MRLGRAMATPPSAVQAPSWLSLSACSKTATTSTLSMTSTRRNSRLISTTKTMSISCAWAGTILRTRRVSSRRDASRTVTRMVRRSIGRSSKRCRRQHQTKLKHQFHPFLPALRNKKHSYTTNYRAEIALQFGPNHTSSPARQAPQTKGGRPRRRRQAHAIRPGPRPTAPYR